MTASGADPGAAPGPPEPPAPPADLIAGGGPAQISTACPSCKAVFRLAAAARHRPGACPFCSFRFFIREGMGDLIIEGGTGKRALAICDSCKARGWVSASNDRAACPLCKIGYLRPAAEGAASAEEPRLGSSPSGEMASALGAAAALAPTPAMTPAPPPPVAPLPTPAPVIVPSITPYPGVARDDPFAAPPPRAQGGLADVIDSTFAPLPRHVPEPSTGRGGRGLPPPGQGSPQGPLGRYEPPPMPRFGLHDDLAPGGGARDHRSASGERAVVRDRHGSGERAAIARERAADADTQDDVDAADGRRHDSRERARRASSSGERPASRATPRPGSSSTRRAAAKGGMSNESVLLLVAAIAFLLGASVGFSAGALVFRTSGPQPGEGAGASASSAAGPSAEARTPEEETPRGPLWSRERRDGGRSPGDDHPRSREGAMAPAGGGASSEDEAGAPATASSGRSAGSSAGRPAAGPSAGTATAAGASGGKPASATGAQPSAGPATEAEDVVAELDEVARAIREMGAPLSVARREAGPRIVAAIDALRPRLDASLALSRELAALLEKDRKELLDEPGTHAAVVAAWGAHAKRLAAAASGPVSLAEARAAAERAAQADLISALDARIAALKPYTGEVRQLAQRADQRARRARAREEALETLRVRASREALDPAGLERFAALHRRTLQRALDLASASGEPGVAFEAARALVSVDPNHRRARALLGESRQGDAWLRPFEAQQRAAGLAWTRERGFVVATATARYDAGEHFDVAERRWAPLADLEAAHADAAAPWVLEGEHVVVRSSAPLAQGARLLERLEAAYLAVFRRMDLVFTARGDDLGLRLVYGVAGPRRLEARLLRDESQLRALVASSAAPAAFYVPGKSSLVVCDDGALPPATLAREAARQVLEEVGGRGEGAPAWILDGAALELEDALSEGASSLPGEGKPLPEPLRPQALEAPDDLSRRPTAREYRDRLRAGEPEMRLRECVAQGAKRREDAESAARARRGAAAAIHFLLTFDDGRYRADAVEMIRDACRGAPQPLGLYFGLTEETLDALMDRFYRGA